KAISELSASTTNNDQHKYSSCLFAEEASELDRRGHFASRGVQGTSGPRRKVWSGSLQQRSVCDVKSAEQTNETIHCLGVQSDFSARNCRSSRLWTDERACSTKWCSGSGER